MEPPGPVEVLARDALGVVFFEALREGFPEDHARMMGRLAEIFAVDKRGTFLRDARIRREATMAGEAIRRDHAEFALTTPPGVARGYLAAFSGFLRSMADHPLVCAKVAVSGVAALEYEEVRLLEIEAAAQPALHMLRGLAMGRDLAVPADPATQADAQAVALEWTQSPGFDPAWAAAVEMADPGNPVTCAAFMAMFDSIAGSRLTAADRMARTLMYEMARN